jgi:hypothetical protein
MSKETAVAKFKILSRNFLEETEENYKKRLVFEPKILTWDAQNMKHEN